MNKGIQGRGPRTASVRIAAAAATLALGACVLPPKIEPQQKPLAATALSLNGAAVPAAPTGWWKSFGDPQLDALVDQALSQNPLLSEALTRIRSAQAQSAALSAGTLPQLGAQAETQRQHFPAQYIYPPPFRGNEYWVSDIGVALNWDLDLFGRQAALIDQARRQVDAAALDVATARLALAGAIAQNYLDLYRAWESLDIASDTEAQRERLLQLTRKRLAAGLDTQVELKQAEGALPQARLAKWQAQLAADSAVHKLAALANRGGDTAYAAIGRPKIDLDTAVPLPTQLPADLLARRPDVLAAKLRVEAALAGRKAAHQAFYPDINLSALAGLQAIGLGNLFEASSRTLGAGPAIHLPLFDAGRLEAGYAGATAEVDAAIASYNEAVLYAVQQAADQLSRIDSYTHQLAEAQDALRTAQEAYRLAERRYAAGLTSQLSVLSADTQVLSARRAVLDARSNLTLSRVTLLLALGGDFTPPASSNTTLADSGVRP